MSGRAKGRWFLRRGGELDEVPAAAPVDPALPHADLLGDDLIRDAGSRSEAGFAAPAPRVRTGTYVEVEALARALAPPGCRALAAARETIQAHLTRVYRKL